MRVRKCVTHTEHESNTAFSEYLYFMKEGLLSKICLMGFQIWQYCSCNPKVGWGCRWGLAIVIQVTALLIARCESNSNLHCSTIPCKVYSEKKVTCGFSMSRIVLFVP